MRTPNVMAFTFPAFAASLRYAPRPGSRKSLLLMRHGIDDDVRHELEGVGGIGCGIIRIIGPLETVAEIFVPGHQYVDPPALIQDSENLWNFSRRTVLPLLAIAALCD